MFSFNTESPKDGRGKLQTESFSVQSPGFAYGSDFNTSALRMLRIYRTIANLAGTENIKAAHIAECFSTEVWIGGM
jgi:predicted ATPase with chaperone activity